MDVRDYRRLYYTHNLLSLMMACDWNVQMLKYHYSDMVFIRE
jgi:hypothetical protein